jgi:hypothetical protein
MGRSALYLKVRRRKEMNCKKNITRATNSVIHQLEHSNVQINTNNLMHVELQPYLDEPPGTIDAYYPLASIHLGDSLVKHMVYTA